MSDNLPPYGAQPPGYPPPPPGYGQPPYGVPRDHPQATTVLVLGILGLVACQVLSPIAWAMGNRVVREIDASGGWVGGRSMANGGRICGIVGTILLAGSVVLLFLMFVVFGLAVSSSSVSG